jgi:hypothetical protein
MGVTFTDVLESLKAISLVRAVNRLSKGHIRIETAFHYPDGSSVDLFIAHRADPLKGVEPLELTDFGNTIGWLMQLGVNPLRNQRRRKQMQDILSIYEVTEDRSALKCRVSPPQLSEGIIRLGQACIRVADLSFTARFLPRPRFAEEVEDVLEGADFRYEPDAVLLSLADNHSKTIKVDFRVLGPRADTALMLLPDAKNSYNAKRRAEHVFAVFYDLQFWSGHRVAALDDRTDSYQDNDLRRIDEVAAVIPFSDGQAFVDLLGSGSRLHA